MLDIGLTARPLFALIRASGTLNSAEEAANFSEALQFVPPDDDIVVDLSGLSELSEPCAVGLRGQLRQRAEWSETVVVSSDPSVTMQLVRSDVDEVVPVVRSLDHARQLIRLRSRGDAVMGGRV